MSGRRSDPLPVPHLHLHRLLAHGRVEQEIPRDGLDPHHHHQDRRQETQVEQDPADELSEPPCSPLPPAPSLRGQGPVLTLTPSTLPRHQTSSPPRSRRARGVPGPRDASTTPLASCPTRSFTQLGQGLVGRHPESVEVRLGQAQPREGQAGAQEGAQGHQPQLEGQLGEGQPAEREGSGEGGTRTRQSRPW